MKNGEPGELGERDSELVLQPLCHPAKVLRKQPKLKNQPDSVGYTWGMGKSVERTIFCPFRTALQVIQEIAQKTVLKLRVAPKHQMVSQPFEETH